MGHKIDNIREYMLVCLEFWEEGYASGISSHTRTIPEEHLKAVERISEKWDLKYTQKLEREGVIDSKFTLEWCKGYKAGVKRYAD